MQIREQGIVKTFLIERGFGFILRQGAPAIFFHRDELRPEDVDTVRAGTPIEYLAKLDERGRAKAVDLVVLDRDAGAVRQFGSARRTA